MKQKPQHMRQPDADACPLSSGEAAGNTSSLLPAVDKSEQREGTSHGSATLGKHKDASHGSVTLGKREDVRCNDATSGKHKASSHGNAAATGHKIASHDIIAPGRHNKALHGDIATGENSKTSRSNAAPNKRKSRPNENKNVLDSKSTSNKRKHKRLPRWADRLITIMVILIGVGLMTWPWIMDRLESSGVFNQISSVSSTVEALTPQERARIFKQARAYNEQLAGEPTEIPADQIKPYDKQLIFDRDPMMSWVEIPSIDVSMPIYHGMSEEVLMSGVGHLEGTSLPVGGKSSHCVLTAHSGMRNLSMFDDIRALKKGDLVLLHTMNKTLAYKMVSSEVVLPDEVGSLTIKPGTDKVTLVTCTPYGVNDHRLLVHCVRTKYRKKDADKQRSLFDRHWGKREFAVLIVIVALILLLLDIIIHRWRKKHRKKLG